MVLYTKENIINNTFHKTYNFKITRTTFNIRNTNVEINSFDRSPSTRMAEINQFITDLDLFFTEYIDNQNIEILIGDINVNILKSDVITNKYRNLLGSYEFKSYINKATGIEGNSSSCIDHIFIKELCNTAYNFLSFIVEYTITDHYAVCLNIS